MKTHIFKLRVKAYKCDGRLNALWKHLNQPRRELFMEIMTVYNTNSMSYEPGVAVSGFFNVQCDVIAQRSDQTRGEVLDHNIPTFVSKTYKLTEKKNTNCVQRVSKLSELNDLAGKPQQKPNDEKWFSLRHKLQADVVSRKTSEQPISAEKLPFSRTRNLNQLTFDVDIDLLLVASGVAIFIFFFFFTCS